MADFLQWPTRANTLLWQEKSAVASETMAIQKHIQKSKMITTNETTMLQKAKQTILTANTAGGAKSKTHKPKKQIQQENTAYPVNTTKVLQASRSSAKWNSLILNLAVREATRERVCF